MTTVRLGLRVIATESKEAHEGRVETGCGQYWKALSLERGKALFIFGGN